MNISINKHDLLLNKSLIKDYGDNLKFNKFIPTLLNIGLTILFTIITFLFVFVMYSNKSIKYIIKTEAFIFIILNLIFVICFFIFLISTISFIISKISLRRMYLTKYKYLIGVFSVDFLDDTLVLESSERKINILLKGCKIKKENDILLLRDKNNFIVMLPLYKIEDRKSLEKQIYECIGEKNI